MTIDCIYYNDKIRCFRDGGVERFWKKGWNIVENNDNHNGYNVVGINGKMIFRHRLIAFCFLGLNNIVGESGRDDCIDHRYGNKLDNSVDNLRITTASGNQHNRPKAKGYSWDCKYKKWKSALKVNNKNIHLGYYTTEEEARQAYLDGKQKYHIAV